MDLRWSQLDPEVLNLCGAVPSLPLELIRLFRKIKDEPSAVFVRKGLKKCRLLLSFVPDWSLMWNRCAR